VCNNLEFSKPYQLKNYPSQGNEKCIFEKPSQVSFSVQHFSFHICIYRDVLTFVDRFTTLRFTASAALPVARCI
jgi:hypothetical protein